MKLQFMGKNYEKSPSDWNVTEGKVGGLYRGKPWKVHSFREEHRHHHDRNELTYRGVHYIKD